MSEIFTFIEGTNLIAEEPVLEESGCVDQGKKGQCGKMNDENISKAASDGEAKFGYKGNGKFCFGCKTHVGVDMGFGMINKVRRSATDP